MTIKTGLVSTLAIVLAGCGGTEAAPATSAIAAAVLKAGTGIRIDPSSEVISVDDSVVPTGANCAAGQTLQRTATGWACSAAAPDSVMLGGKAASAYATSDGTVANALSLGGRAANEYLTTNATSYDSARLGNHPASYYLPAQGTAVNAAALNGHPDSDFLAAAGTAVNSALLNSHPDSDFLAATGTAADSSKLGGKAPSYYLPATATAADSAKLNGLAASYYLAASATAADSSRLGGIAAANFARSDVATQLRAPLTVKDSSGYGEIFAGSIHGGDNAGNVHVYADSAGSDGYVYLNWFGGNGVKFGNGSQSKVAEIDGSGNMTAASFNGIQMSVVQSPLNTNMHCEAVCWAVSSASCMAALSAPTGTTAWSPRLCGDIYGSGTTLKCVCAKF